MDDTGAVLRRKLRPAKMVNASGAGDSFAAAMLYATLQGYDAEKTLDYGMAAGIAAVHPSEWSYSYESERLSVHHP